MIRGGTADKLGNRYEEKWVVRHLLDVFGGKADSTLWPLAVKISGSWPQTEPAKSRSHSIPLPMANRTSHLMAGTLCSPPGAEERGICGGAKLRGTTLNS